MASGSTAGGRRSEPYAGSGPAGTAGPPATGAAGEDHGPPVITAGATGVAPPPVGGAGAPDVVGGVSTGPLAATNAPPLGTVGGVASGGAACGGGADPDSIACIAPADNDCAPAPVGCPVAIPVATDAPTRAKSPGQQPRVMQAHRARPAFPVLPVHHRATAHQRAARLVVQLAQFRWRAHRHELPRVTMARGR